MTALEVRLIDSVSRDNSKRRDLGNYTEQYDLTETGTAVLRRGAYFYLRVRFTEEYDANRDVVKLIFEFGNNPKIDTNTKAVALVQQNKANSNVNEWWAYITDNRQKTDLTLYVHISPYAPVGEWRLKVQTNVIGDRQNFKNSETTKFYVLFNPWSNLDSVYLENEEYRREYVLNEDGVIWTGTVKSPKGIDWNFDQFDDRALPLAVSLLDKSELPDSSRGDPVRVVRTISQMVNADDENGLLVEKLGGPYSGVDRYGQCWLYSAIVVTICRTLGIPCRSVTNYGSAHDVASASVSRYFDDDGNLVGGDSVWSYHCWNEVWMTRPDLRSGKFDGWQVIDGTPLRRSDSTTRCGPASVAAIKSGDVGLSYDTERIYSEINSAIRYFQTDQKFSNGHAELTAQNYRVGSKIITKDLSSRSWVDITLSYKNPPASSEQDVVFELIDIDSIPLGEEFDVVVKVRNTSTQNRTISATLKATSDTNTKELSNVIKTVSRKKKLGAGKERTLSMHVAPKEYLPQLVGAGHLNMSSVASVEETGQRWHDEDDIILDPPEMTIAVQPGIVKEQESVAVTFSFTNPLNRPLTNCRYIVEGPTREKAFRKEHRDVRPHERIDITEEIVVTRRGRRQVIVKFVSTPIWEISASTYILVE